MARGCYRCADARQPATGDEHVGFQIHQPRMRFGGGERSLRRRNPSEIGTRGRTLLRGGTLPGSGVRQHDQGIAAESGPCEKSRRFNLGPSAILSGISILWTPKSH
jgi:hypothetical protein